MNHVILKNTDRYPGIDPDMPSVIICNGTLTQAIKLAERLSNRNAGCDYAYYVVGEEN
jgi:hypothetical protein